MSKLTEEERQTLDAAHAIIVSHTPHGASWLIGFSHTGVNAGPAYFDSLRTQHMLWDEEMLSGVVARGVEIEGTVSERSELVKKARIAALKAELEKLGAAA